MKSINNLVNTKPMSKKLIFHEAKILFDEILQRVTHCGGAQATIAGGAVRDSVLGKEIADIDIFCFSSKGKVNASVLETVFPGVQKADASELYEISDINSVYNCSYKGWKVQIIVLGMIHANDRVINHVEKFPCNISKVWYDGKSHTWEAGTSFYTGLAHEILVFDKGASSKYMEKICNKYSEYKIKVPSSIKLTQSSWNPGDTFTINSDPFIQDNPISKAPQMRCLNPRS